MKHSSPVFKRAKPPLRTSELARHSPRAQASIEALLVLLTLLILLQVLGSSLQIFHSNYQSLYLLSSEQQTLATQALILSVRVCDNGVALPTSIYSAPQTDRAELISQINSSIRMPVLGPLPRYRTLS